MPYRTYTPPVIPIASLEELLGKLKTDKVLQSPFGEMRYDEKDSRCYIRCSFQLDSVHTLLDNLVMNDYTIVYGTKLFKYASYPGEDSAIPIDQAFFAGGIDEQEVGIIEKNKKKLQSIERSKLSFSDGEAIHLMLFDRTGKGKFSRIRPTDGSYNCSLFYEFNQTEKNLRTFLTYPNGANEVVLLQQALSPIEKVVTPALSDYLRKELNKY